MYRHLLIAVDGSLLSESAFKRALECRFGQIGRAHV